MDGEIRIRRIHRSFEDAAHETVEVDELLVESGIPEEEITTNHARQWTKIGRWCVTAIVALTPLFFLPYTIAPVEISKLVFVAALAIIATVSLLITVIENRTFAYPGSQLVVPVLAVIGAFGVSTLFSTSRVLSVYGNFIKPDTFVVVVIGGMLSFLGFYFLRREHLPRLLTLFLTSSVLATIIGIAQAFERFVLPWNFTQNAGFNTLGSIAGWGIMMATVLSIITVLPLERFTWRRRFIVFATGLLMFAGLLILNYQLLWVGIAFLMIIISATRFVAKERLGWSIVIAILTVFLALVSPHIPRMGRLPLEVRPSLPISWTVAKETVVGKRLLIGSGPGTFSYDYSLHRPIEVNQGSFWGIRFDQGHNGVVTTLANVGLFGILAFMMLLLAVMRVLIRSSEDKEIVPLATGILALMVGGIFFPIFFTQIIFIFLGVGILALLTAPRREVSFTDLSVTKSFLSFIAAVFLIAVVLSSLYVVGQKYYAAVAFGKGVEAFGQGDIPASLKYITTAVRWDDKADHQWRSASQVLLARANQLISANDASTAGEVQQAVSSAVDAARRATVANPADAVNWSNAGMVYLNILPLVPGAEMFAVENFKEAIKRDPKNPVEPVNAARALLTAVQQLRGGSEKEKVRDYLNQAESFLRDAIELKEQHPSAYYYLGLVFDEKGDKDEALVALTRALELNPESQEIKDVIEKVSSGQPAF